MECGRKFRLARHRPLYLVPERRARSVRGKLSEIRGFRGSAQRKASRGLARQRWMSMEFARRIQSSEPDAADERAATFPRGDGESSGGISRATFAAGAAENAGGKRRDKWRANPATL